MCECVSVCCVLCVVLCVCGMRGEGGTFVGYEGYGHNN